MIACDYNKENLPNEEDYQELPGSYRDGDDDDEEEDDDDDEEEEEEEDDEDETLFTSRWLFTHNWFGTVVAVWSLLGAPASW